MAEPTDQEYDVEFFWDPVCPFAWVTSRWVTEVMAVRGLTVDWRFIALRILNEEKDYGAEFPKGYPAGHHAGLRALRVASAVREAEGRAPMGPLYTALGEGIWDRTPDRDSPNADLLGGYEQEAATRTALAACGLAESWAEHLDDESQDAAIRADTEDGLSRTGDDVGTPIVSVAPPDGPAFFGPVISRVPRGEEAGELWDAVMKIASWPGFAEIKRTLREMPQVPLITGEPAGSAVG